MIFYNVLCSIMSTLFSAKMIAIIKYNRTWISHKLPWCDKFCQHLGMYQVNLYCLYYCNWVLQERCFQGVQNHWIVISLAAKAFFLWCWQDKIQLDAMKASTAAAKAFFPNSDTTHNPHCPPFPHHFGSTSPGDWWSWQRHLSPSVTLMSLSGDAKRKHKSARLFVC